MLEKNTIPIISRRVRVLDNTNSGRSVPSPDCTRRFRNICVVLGSLPDFTSRLVRVDFTDQRFVQLSRSQRFRSSRRLIERFRLLKEESA